MADPLIHAYETLTTRDGEQVEIDTERAGVWSKDSYSGMRHYGTDRDDKKKATPSPSLGPDMTAAPRATAEPSAQAAPSATGFCSTAPPGEHSWMGSDVGMVVSAFSGIFISGSTLRSDCRR